MKPSATIIGGSMAGLFAATALSKNGWEISIHEKVPVPLSGRGAGIATYDELADLVFKATNNNDVLGTTAKLRVSLDNDLNVYLLELNKGPDMTSKNDKDYVLKYRIYEDLLNKIGIIKHNKKNMFENID